MLRTTPLHLLFPDGAIDRSRLVSISDDARGSGQDPWNMLAVAALPTVAEWVTELRPGDEDPHTVHAYSSLVFYGMHVTGPVGGLLSVSEEVGRGLAEGSAGVVQWSARPPSAAGYVQLPQNVFWIQTGVDEPEEANDRAGLAEPLDGIFWATAPDETPARAGLWVMMAAGLRPGRPGFSAIALDRLPFADIGLWADEDMRGDGKDFENLLPGGDLAGFLTIGTAGEALKLLARVWRHASLYGSESSSEATSPALPYRILNPRPDPDHG